MKSIISLICLAICLPAYAQKGWVSLFDGKSITGWHNYKKTTVEGWAIDQEALTSNGKGGDLVTDKEYGDFDLQFDFKASPKGNSGVIYKVDEVMDDAHFSTYASGPEYQIIDDVNYPEKLKDVQHTGANYDINPPSKIASKAAGEWNHGEIIIKNNKITHIVNGIKVVTYTYGDAGWQANVAKSKFAKWPYAMAHAKGKIALQGHGDIIAFKNIKIKEL